MKQVQEEANVLGDRESKFLDVLEIWHNSLSSLKYDD